MKVNLSHLGSVCLIESIQSEVSKSKLRYVYGLIIDINQTRENCKVYFPNQKIRKYEDMNKSTDIIYFNQIKAIGPRPNFKTFFNQFKKLVSSVL